MLDGHCDTVTPPPELVIRELSALPSPTGAPSESNDGDITFTALSENRAPNIATSSSHDPDIPADDDRAGEYYDGISHAASAPVFSKATLCPASEPAVGHSAQTTMIGIPPPSHRVPSPNGPAPRRRCANKQLRLIYFYNANARKYHRLIMRRIDPLRLTRRYCAHAWSEDALLIHRAGKFCRGFITVGPTRKRNNKTAIA